MNIALRRHDVDTLFGIVCRVNGRKFEGESESSFYGLIPCKLSSIPREYFRIATQLELVRLNMILDWDIV